LPKDVRGMEVVTKDPANDTMQQETKDLHLRVGRESHTREKRNIISIGKNVPNGPKANKRAKLKTGSRDGSDKGRGYGESGFLPLGGVLIPESGSKEARGSRGGAKKN